MIAIGVILMNFGKIKVPVFVVRGAKDDGNGGSGLCVKHEVRREPSFGGFGVGGAGRNESVPSYQ